jgi:hypothetical protein
MSTDIFCFEESSENKGMRRTNIGPIMRNGIIISERYTE